MSCGVGNRSGTSDMDTVEDVEMMVLDALRAKRPWFLVIVASRTT